MINTLKELKAYCFDYLKSTDMPNGESLKLLLELGKLKRELKEENRFDLTHTLEEIIDLFLYNLGKMMVEKSDWS